MWSSIVANKHIKARSCSFCVGLLFGAASMLALVTWLLATSEVAKINAPNTKGMTHLIFGRNLMPPVRNTVADALSRLPPVVIHDSSIYFKNVAEALQQTLVELQIPSSIAKDMPSSHNTTTITFLTHDQQTNLSQAQPYISYNFEQLTTNKQWHPELWNRFKAAEMVWDYSLENIKVLHAHNITHTVHMPLGYASTMDNPASPAAMAKDIDILFVGVLGGGLCQHRHPHLEAVAHAVRPANSSGLPCASRWAAAPSNITNVANTTQQLLPSAVLTDSCWGQGLQQMYWRSKVALNLHCYPGKTILEVHRVLPLVVNRVLVLSEHSDDPWWDAQYSNLVNFTQGADVVQNMGAMLQQLQQGANTYAVEAEQRYQRLLACCSYKQYVSAALRQPITLRQTRNMRSTVAA